MMALANLLLCLSVTMLIPTMPHWLLFEEGLSSSETGFVMGAFAVGLFLPGGLCSFLVQHYRRNLVCVWATLLLAVSIVLPQYVTFKGMLLAAVLLRLVQGTAFGLAQIVLTSTLIIDACESSQRTEAGHAVTWFGRFALGLGPAMGLVLVRLFGFDGVLWVSAGCCLLTVLGVLLVHFPFRAPSDGVHLFSLDRYLLTIGWPLLFHLFFVTLVIGMVLSLPFNEQFYGLMMLGFLLSILAQYFIFSEADMKSEIVSGLILMGASLLILLTSPTSVLMAPLLGSGIGLVGARFLLLFIKLSRHCQRGTSQSTYMLGWESGLSLGIGLGYGLFIDNCHTLVFVALTIIVFVLLSYNLWLHQWFMNHKNR